MFDDARIAQLAQELHTAEKTRTQIEHFSKRFPEMTIEDGYRINRAWMQLKFAEGRKMIGHKIGLTSRAMQVSSQIDEPDYGTLLDDMLVRVESREALSPEQARHSADGLAKRLKGMCGLSADVEVAAPGAVERSMGKARRVIDKRPKA